MSASTPTDAKIPDEPTWEEFHRRAVALNIMVVEREQPTAVFYQPGPRGRRLYLNKDLPPAKRLAAGWELLNTLESGHK